MIFRVGLTGGLASGKSTVARRLREHGIPVLDADQIVRDLYRPGAAGARAVAEEFGPEYLDASGAVERTRLAARVFGDPEALGRLNGRIHPLVLAEQSSWFRSLEAKGDRLGVVEATLLVETGGRSRYDILIAVSAPEDVRLERAARRDGGDPLALKGRIRAQLPDADREKVADVVLRTDGRKEDLLQRVDRLAAELKSAAARSAEEKGQGGEGPGPV